MSYHAASFRHLQDNFNFSIQEADLYFESLADSIGLGMPKELDPNIQDSGGLVSYIVASTNPPPPQIKELYDEIVPVMEGLIDVVVSAVLKSAGNDDPKKHDPSSWKTPMEMMMSLFCGGRSQGTQFYDHEIVGVEVPSKFLNILIEEVVSQGAALDSFAKFLQSQGETMRAEASGKGNGYLYAIVSIVHKIFQAADGRWLYGPEFKICFTKFSRETFKLTNACASSKQFRFQFDLEIISGVFMVETWKTNLEFQKLVREFINKYKQTSIKDSENYFEEIFESIQE